MSVAQFIVAHFIWNGPGEAAVQGREVGDEGFT